MFSGSSTTRGALNIRTASGATTFLLQDSWDWLNSASANSGQMFIANSPSNANLSLSPLFSSSNTNDIASVRARIPGGGRTNITFAASTTNTPTITIASGSRTISHLFMDDDSLSADDMGIRVLEVLCPIPSGILRLGLAPASSTNRLATSLRELIGEDLFFSSLNDIQVRVNSQIIPEPEEYALVFALLALGFVILRHHLQKKKRQAAAVIDS